MYKFLRNRLFPGGNTRQVNGLGVPGYQRMPPEKILSTGHASISTRKGKPAKCRHFSRGQLQALLNQRCPVRIGSTATALDVQQVAGYVRVIDPAGFLVLEFLQTAEPATIA